MQDHDPKNQSPRLSLADIYYIPFRHKWKILLISAAGFLAAAGVYVVFEVRPTYSSEAKLFIRYVVESRLPSGIAGDPQIKTPDPGGAHIINSEMEIIRSRDLALAVVRAVGVGTILGSTSETNENRAVADLQRGLTVALAPNSDIVLIRFENSNPNVVRPVLSQFIDAYLRRHVEIHRNMGAFDDILTQQTDALRSQLAQTEQEIQQAKKLNALEPALTELHRKKDLEESKYRHFSTLLEQARFDEALYAGRIPNISVIQTPTPPFPLLESRQLSKTFGIICCAGVICGIALAGLCEFKRRLGLKPVSQQPSPISR